VIDHVFFGVSDWGLGEGWQALLGDRAADAVESEPHAFRAWTIRSPRTTTVMSSQAQPHPRQVAAGVRRSTVNGSYLK